MAVSTAAAVSESLLLGLGFACVYSVIAIVAVLIASAADRAPAGVGLPLTYIIGGYFAGGLLAGLIVGLLRRLTTSPLGTMVVGILAGTCVYGAIAPALSVIDVQAGKPPLTLAAQFGIAITCGLMAGPPGALILRSEK